MIPPLGEPSKKKNGKSWSFGPTRGGGGLPMQCPKENVLFLMMSSLKDNKPFANDTQALSCIYTYISCIYVYTQCLFVFVYIFICICICICRFLAGIISTPLYVYILCVIVDIRRRHYRRNLKDFSPFLIRLHKRIAAHDTK